jgi:diguanylate cyclase (GGDEF)-like protein/PAS domain S-box-containing protein
VASFFVLLSGGLYFLNLEFSSFIQSEKQDLSNLATYVAERLPREALLESLATKDSQSPSDSQLLGNLNEWRGLEPGLSLTLIVPNTGEVIQSTDRGLSKGDLIALPRYLTTSWLKDSQLSSMVHISPDVALISQKDVRSLQFRLWALRWHYLFLGVLFLAGSLGFIAIFTQRSKRKSLATNEMLATLFRESADAVLVLDKNGKIRDANPAALELFQKSIEALRAINFCHAPASELSLIPLGSTKSVLKNTLELEESWRSKAKLILNGEGLRYIQFSSAPLPEKEGALLIFQDITQDVMREQELVHSLRQKNAQLQQQMITDPLTQVLNKHYLSYTLEDKNLKWLKTESCSMLLIDLDDFKQLNDRYGHQFGDQILKSFGQFLRNFFRRSDKVIRYGGDEFVVLLPGTGLKEASRIAQNFVEALRKTRFDDQTSLTASVGVAELGAEDSGRDWFERADAAMYGAKHEGKNAFRLQTTEELEVLN